MGIDLLKVTIEDASVKNFPMYRILCRIQHDKITWYDDNELNTVGV